VFDKVHRVKLNSIVAHELPLTKLNARLLGWAVLCHTVYPLYSTRHYIHATCKLSVVSSNSVWRPTAKCKPCQTPVHTFLHDAPSDLVVVVTRLWL